MKPEAPKVAVISTEECHCIVCYDDEERYDKSILTSDMHELNEILSGLADHYIITRWVK